MLINLHLEGELEDIYLLMKLGIYTNSFVLFSDMAGDLCKIPQNPLNFTQDI